MDDALDDAIAIVEEEVGAGLSNTRNQLVSSLKKKGNFDKF